jgi:hypothetical protein
MDASDDIRNILGSNEKIELYIEEKTYHPRINIVPKQSLRRT